MVITVKVDKMFQASLPVDCLEHLKGTSFEASFLSQKALLEFVKTVLAVKEYKDKEELQRELKKWEEFAGKKIKRKELPCLPKDYEKLWINGDNVVTAQNILGWLLIIANISRVNLIAMLFKKLIKS